MTDVAFLCRTLTDRQKSLLMSYAEDETDVEGTVNGVTATTTGKTASLLYFSYLYIPAVLLDIHPGFTKLGRQGRTCSIFSHKPG